jgi:hypothetical protein
MFAVSEAKSVSVIRLRDDCRLVFVVPRLAIVLSKRFWIAPYCAR